MRTKKSVVLLMIIISLFITSSLIGCDKKDGNNKATKNQSENCETGDTEPTSKPPK